MQEDGYFYYWICDFGHFYEVRRNFKNIFSRPLFTIIFKPKIVFLNTGSILRIKTMYESVKEDVLRYWLGRCFLVQFLFKTKIWSDTKKHLPSQYFNSRYLTFRRGCYNFPIPSTMDPKSLWSRKCILIICDFIMNLAQSCLWIESGRKVTNLQLISFFVSKTKFSFSGLGEM